VYLTEPISVETMEQYDSEMVGRVGYVYIAVPEAPTATTTVDAAKSPTKAF
jgi:hypothetical protein